MKKLLSGSFWLVMLTHVVVFTGIGLFTAKGWRLLIVFLAGLAVLLVLFAVASLHSKRHPEKRRLAAVLSFFHPRGGNREKETEEK
jgi:uncharacterized membrane protein YhaH (DUF805 family)